MQLMQQLYETHSSGSVSQDQTPEELQDEVKKLRNDLKDTQ
jgi:hypothetical protein